MDLEELKAWAFMLGVELTPDAIPSGGMPPQRWTIFKDGWTEHVWDDQSAEHWLAVIKSVAEICSLQD